VGNGDEPTSDEPGQDLLDVLGVGAAGDDRSPMIGRYKLLQKVGEGGFGVVYMAEQTSPVRRRVAIKLIKAGMDSKAVVARFEAERQALAMMEHPSIARVLDGGATELDFPGGGGRPYFVMELVSGVAITRYADDNRLSPKQRIELFVPVCRAVQHAHTKGVIHRDLKPGNVLVAMHDGKPVPKVIDFGIAKATLGRLTDQTLFTDFRHRIGTPAYMSPEQAEMSGLDVDTRSDIYSLGVMLYELLTGAPPFEKEQLLGKGDAEMLRILREVEPPRPSTRVGTGPVSEAALRRCRVAPARLGRMLAGDLDWVVMKCLEKDRTRRYDSSGALADDLQRYLDGEGVTATPPSAVYRIRRFVRRYRIQVALTAVVAFALAGGLVMTSYGLLKARDQRDAALRAGLVEAGLRSQAEAARADADKQRADADTQRLAAESARRVAEDAARRSESVKSILLSVISAGDPGQTGRTDVTVRDVADSIDRRLAAGVFAAEPLTEADVRVALSILLLGLGETDRVEGHLNKALQIRQAELGPRHLSVAEVYVQLAELAGRRAEYVKAVRYTSDAVSIVREQGDTAWLFAQLGYLAWAGERISQSSTDDERWAQATAASARAELAQLRARLPTSTTTQPGDSGGVDRWVDQQERVLSLIARRDFAAAEPISRALVVDVEAEFKKWQAQGRLNTGGKFNWLLTSLQNHGLVLSGLRKPEAVDVWRRRLAYLRAGGDGHPDLVRSAYQLAGAQRDLVGGERATIDMREASRLALAEADRLLARNPNDAHAKDRAVLLWRQGETRRAIDALSRLTEPGATRPVQAAGGVGAFGAEIPHAWFLRAAMLLESGDAAGAAEIARRMETRLAGDTTPFTQEHVARTLLLACGDDAACVKRAGALLDASDKTAASNSWRNRQTRTLLQLRSGERADAVKRAGLAITGDSAMFEARTVMLAIAALGHAGTGNTTLAQHLAAGLVRDASTEMDEYRRLHPDTPVDDWLIAHRMLAEIKVAIGPIAASTTRATTRPGETVAGVLASTEVAELQAAAVLGRPAVVEGRVTYCKWSATGKILNMFMERGDGKSPYDGPGDAMMLIVFVRDREAFDKAFGGDVALTLDGKVVRVSGKVVKYGGYDQRLSACPQIVLSDPSQVTIVK
jgi:tetratricopeptide (TPR) repeat protein